MTKKQKKVLYQIIAAVILIVILKLLPAFPTPVGMTVTCESELTAVEGRKLVFKVSLHDEKGPVGGGVHERFVVHDAKFAAKAESKKG